MEKATSKLAVLLASIIFLTSCASGKLNFQSPMTRTPKFETVERLAAGELPASPDAAQNWLDSAVQDFRAAKKQANLVCIGIAAFNDGQYPAQCIKLDAWYLKRAVPLRQDIEVFIVDWRMAGGKLNEAATEYFAQTISAKIPEVERLLTVLRAFKAGDIDEPPTLPKMDTFVTTANSTP